MKLRHMFAAMPLCVAALIASAEVLPENSIYQLDNEWHTATEQPFQLKQLQGKRQVVAMIYTHCHHACPVIVHSMKTLEKQLTAEEKQSIGFTLISFTPETDTPEVLQAYAKQFDLGDNWTLLRGTDAQVRTFANVIGMKYKIQADGSVDHASTLTLLDKNGVILATLRGVEDEVPTMLQTLRKTQ